jgi:hypothetical protein
LSGQLPRLHHAQRRRVHTSPLPCDTKHDENPKET